MKNKSCRVCKQYTYSDLVKNILKDGTVQLWEKCIKCGENIHGQGVYKNVRSYTQQQIDRASVEKDLREDPKQIKMF